MLINSAQIVLIIIFISRLSTHLCIKKFALTIQNHRYKIWRFHVYQSHTTQITFDQSVSQESCVNNTLRPFHIICLDIKYKKIPKTLYHNKDYKLSHIISKLIYGTKFLILRQLYSNVGFPEI